jgi:hypothetical protein
MTLGDMVAPTTPRFALPLLGQEGKNKSPLEAGPYLST